MKIDCKRYHNRFFWFRFFFGSGISLIAGVNLLLKMGLKSCENPFLWCHNSNVQAGTNMNDHSNVKIICENKKSEEKQFLVPKNDGSGFRKLQFLIFRLKMKKHFYVTKLWLIYLPNLEAPRSFDQDRGNSEHIKIVDIVNISRSCTKWTYRDRERSFNLAPCILIFTFS